MMRNRPTCTSIIVESEKHQRALGSFYRENYLHNVAMGWPTAEENAARRLPHRPALARTFRPIRRLPH